MFLLARKIYYVNLFFLLFQVVVLSQEIKEKTEEIIRSSFKEKIILEMQKYLLPSDIKNRIEKEVSQRFYSDHVFVYKIFSENLLKGHAVLDNVYGKTMPITFVVIFDISGNIFSSDIVKYREPYGGGVANKSWSNKFKDKNSKSDFTVGKDIDAISGATISVNSLTKGIKKLSLLIQEIKNRL